MKKHLIICIGLLAMWTNLTAQDPQITWQQCHHKTNNIFLSRGCVSGTKILVPSTVSLGLGQGYGFEDVLFSLFDTLGNYINDEVYGGIGTELVSKAVPDGKGNFYILAITTSTDGCVNSGNKGGTDIWVLHVDSAGMILSEKTYGTSNHDFAADLLPMPDGGYYLVGNIWRKDGDVTQHNGGENIWVARCKADGTIIRQFALGDTNNYSCNHVFINAKGNFVFTGKIDPKTSYGDVLIMETDTLGNKLWQRVYGGWSEDYGVETKPFKDGYLVLASVGGPGGHVVGFHTSQPTPLCGTNHDIWLLFINGEGLLQRHVCLGGTNDEIPANLIVDGIDITVFGNTQSTDGDIFGKHSKNCLYDSWVAKVSENGKLMWQHCFGGSGEEQVSFGVKSKPGYYTMVAKTFNSSNNGDVGCSITNPSTWFINFRVCNGGEPGIPAMPTGQDSVNTTTSLQLTYAILLPDNAWAFDWKLEPQEAGTVEGHGLWAVVDWAQGFKGNANLSARCYNQCGWGEWGMPLQVTAHNAIGITELSQSGIAVWPNPANNILNIALPQNIQLPIHLTLTNLTGRALHTQQLTQAQTAINLSSLPQGVFFCHLASTEINVTAKIVKGL